MDKKDYTTVPHSRIEDCTIGPVPVNGIVEIMHQLREQSWKVSFVAFAGMIMVQEKIMMAGKNGTPLPSYVIIAEKYFDEGAEFVPPQIKMGGSTGSPTGGMK